MPLPKRRVSSGFPVRRRRPLSRLTRMAHSSGATRWPARLIPSRPLRKICHTCDQSAGQRNQPAHNMLPGNDVLELRRSTKATNQYERQTQPDSTQPGGCCVAAGARQRSATRRNGTLRSRPARRCSPSRRSAIRPSSRGRHPSPAGRCKPTPISPRQPGAIISAPLSTTA